MKINTISTWLLLFVLTLSSCNDQSYLDPYRTLGLSKSATTREIKRAYKELVRIWHPDKNEDVSAAEKFMAITRAYELLSDPVRKERYDKFGTYDDESTSTQHGFEDFFNQQFRGFDTGSGIYTKHRITYRMFHNNLMDASHMQPYIIFVYSTYCQLCYRLEPLWQSVVDDLEPLGYGIGTVNAMSDGNLLEKLRVSRLPSIVVLVEGRIMHFRGSMHAKSIRLFARDVIPNTFMISITNYDGLKRFVDQWSTTNKISVIMFGIKDQPRLRYLLASMKYANFARFAYIYQSNEVQIREMKEALSISCTTCETILIFNDFPENGPVARMTWTNQMSVEAIKSLIESNKYLVLPRLSSQAHMDELCPVSSRNPRKLCAIMLVSERTSELKHISTLRNFVQSHQKEYNSDRIRFAYMFADRQREFIRSFQPKLLTSHDGNTAKQDSRDIIVVWRVEQLKVRYALLRSVWNGGDNDDVLNDSRKALESAVDAILHGSMRLDDQAALNMIVDEFTPSWFNRMSKKTMRMWESLWFHVTKEETLPVISAIGTLFIILFIGYALSYLSSSSSSTTKTRQQHSTNTSSASNINDNRSSQQQSSTKIRREFEHIIHELRAETYFGMVRLLKPGCRSIVILVDDDTKDQLLAQFCQHVWPWRKNKTITFGYINVNKNLAWFRKLLEHVLPTDADNDPNGTTARMYERLKHINPRQTLGTVLVLCGWKLYFCIYHPMHTTTESRAYLEYDDDEDENHEEIIGHQLAIDQVLHGLPNWLDRLFEGSINRYYVPEWPDNLK